MEPGLKRRCSWAIGDEMIKYHDTEWGKPEHNDNALYEFLILEGAQAGLSWSTILKKREGYRKAFANFDPHMVATYTNRNVETLLQNPTIVRNRRKIESAINNAVQFYTYRRNMGALTNLSGKW